MAIPHDNRQVRLYYLSGNRYSRLPRRNRQVRTEANIPYLILVQGLNLDFVKKLNHPFNRDVDYTFAEPGLISVPRINNFRILLYYPLLQKNIRSQH